MMEILEDRALETVASVVQEEKLALTSSDLESLAHAGLEWLMNRNEKLLRSAMQRGSVSEYVAADLAFLDLSRDYLDAQLERYIRTKLEGRNDRYDMNQREWLLHGSLANVASYLAMLPTIHDIRRSLLGTEAPLAVEEAVKWLIEHDVSAEPRNKGYVDALHVGARKIEPSAPAPFVSSSALKEARSVPIVSMEDVISSRDGITGQAAVMVVEQAPTSSRVETDREDICVISFHGPLTRELKIRAEGMGEEAGGWLSAIWLILIGVWPGKSLEVCRRPTAGQPSFSVAQEALVITALEMQSLTGLCPLTEEFYSELLQWWKRQKVRIREGMPGNPRLVRAVARYESTEQVRKALSRFRRHLNSIASTSISCLSSSREMEREREALEAMRMMLVDMGWLA